VGLLPALEAPAEGELLAPAPPPSFGGASLLHAVKPTKTKQVRPVRVLFFTMDI
jgi:hypothetical protein